MNIPKVEYDIYSKLSGNHLIKLNLSICENTKISLSIPIEITDSLDKVNSSSGYYNDICYTAISDYGTDISLEDRKKEYIDGNKMVCQENCDFSEYDSNTKKAKCLCNAQESSSSFADMKIDKKKLYQSFTDIKNIVNFRLMKCYKVLFSKNGILYNISNYIIIFVILFHFIIIIIYYKKHKYKLYNIIKDISFGINNYDLIKTERKEKERTKTPKVNEPVKKNNYKNRKLLYKKNNKNKNKESSEIKEIKLLQTNNFYIQEEINTNIRKNKKENNKNNNKNDNNLTLKGNKKNENNNSGSLNKILNVQNQINRIKKIMVYNDEEINNLPYKLALIYDKRKYCEYYISLLKTKHLFIFTFLYNDDYNSKIIKINLFFINFIMDYAVNGLFFNDETMHKIYEDQGSFNFIYQLPQTIYSSLISTFLTKILELLALTEDNIIKFKSNKNKISLNKRIAGLKKNLNIKIIIYFIFSFILLLFFWYYLSIFGAVYKNTQYHLIKDTIISFSLSLLYPFGIYLIPGFFRIPALSNPKNKKEYLYKIGLVFHII